MFFNTKNFLVYVVRSQFSEKSWKNFKKIFYYGLDEIQINIVMKFGVHIYIFQRTAGDQYQAPPGPDRVKVCWILVMSCLSSHWNPSVHDWPQKTPVQIALIGINLKLRLMRQTSWSLMNRRAGHETQRFFKCTLK